MQNHTSSQRLGFPPAFSKQLIISLFPLSAATCNGVAPPALTFGSAPACKDKRNKLNNSNILYRTYEGYENKASKKVSCEYGPPK